MEAVPLSFEDRVVPLFISLYWAHKLLMSTLNTWALKEGIHSGGFESRSTRPGDTEFQCNVRTPLGAKEKRLMAVKKGFPSTT